MLVHQRVSSFNMFQHLGRRETPKLPARVKGWSGSRILRSASSAIARPRSNRLRVRNPLLVSSCLIFMRRTHSLILQWMSWKLAEFQDCVCHVWAWQQGISQGFLQGIPSGELTFCYGKIHHFLWENPLFLWPFSSSYVSSLFSSSHFPVVLWENHYFYGKITIFCYVSSPGRVVSGFAFIWRSQGRVLCQRSENLVNKLTQARKHQNYSLENHGKIMGKQGQRNSGFSHEKWWFSIVFCMFTRG